MHALLPEFFVMSPMPHAMATVSRAAPRGEPSAANAWVLVCAARLLQLHPRQSRAAALRQAHELWSDLPMFDPVLAAEMEHESRVAGPD